MEKQEWLSRYKQAFIDNANLTPEEAKGCAEACSFEEASTHFEEDPEGAALEEMSYWES